MDKTNKFKVIISEDVDKFLDGLSPKAKAKNYIISILWPPGRLTKNYSKNLTVLISGNSERCLPEPHIGFCRFLIPMRML